MAVPLTALPRHRRFTGEKPSFFCTVQGVKGGVNLDHFGGAKVDQLVKG